MTDRPASPAVLRGPPSRAALPHAAYFEALGGLSEGGGPRWSDVLGGLVTLRLVDRWVRLKAGRLSRSSLHAAEQAVRAMDARGSTQGPVHEIIAALRTATSRADGAVLTHVLGYAHALRFAADWALAADGYQTVIDAAITPEEWQLVPEAYDRLGYCRRMEGQIEDALAAYAAGRALAERQHDTATALRIQISEANVAIHRGNFPAAEQLLDRIIAAAEQADLPAVAALALHDRGLVAHVRGDVERGILYYHEALIHASDAAHRDRLLADLGRAFGELGARDVAREALLLLYATGTEQVDRWIAAINLLELAALDGQETVFEEYRRDLAAVALPPRCQAFYYLFVGEGCARFGRIKCTLEALERAIEVSRQYGVNEVEYRAEIARDAFQKDRAAPASPAQVEVPETVAHVASALHILRQQAATAGA